MTTRFSTLWTAFFVLVSATCTHSFVIPTTSLAPTTTTTTITTNNIVGANSCLSMGLLDGLSGAEDAYEKFTTKATVSHILCSSQNALRTYKKDIRNSRVDFARYARKHSKCSESAKVGGKLGEIVPGQMPKEFDAVAFKEAVGEVHGPVQTDLGFHLIYINERSD